MHPDTTIGMIITPLLMRSSKIIFTDGIMITIKQPVHISTCASNAFAVWTLVNHIYMAAQHAIILMNPGID